MYNDEIYFHNREYEDDNCGNNIEKLSKGRKVLGFIKGIDMREFYAAATTDLVPELIVELADYRNYKGEKIVICDSVKYRILRNYRKGRKLNLILTTKMKDSKHE